MSLRALFTRLYAEAEARGEASAQLHGGASVRVRVSGTRRQVILGRAGAPIGLIEAQTFEAYGRIPDHAEVVCYLPTATRLYRVAYTWGAEGAPARLDLAAAAEPPAPAAEPEPEPEPGHTWRLLETGEPLPGSL